MIKFTVYIPTYNRPELVRHAITSILNQTYKEFEILLFDNGSTPSVEEAVKSFQDPRIRYFRNEQNQETNSVAKRALEQMSGTHFLYLADDDALVPSTMEIVAKLIQQNPKIEIISTSVADFNHTTGHPILKQNWEEATGKLTSYRGIDILTFCCRSWSIGYEGLGAAPLRLHSSGTFLSKDLIERTKKTQGDLFVRPFGDVGFTGAGVIAGDMYFLDLPLAIIGHSTSQESTANRGGRRHIFDKYREDLAHLPVKGSTFISMGAASHMNVLHRLGLASTFDTTLRPDFFLRHFLQIWTDQPKTSKSWCDLRECLWPGFKSGILALHPRRLGHLYKIFQFWRARSTSQKTWQQKAENSGTIQKTDSLTFKNVCDFSNWLQTNYVERLSNLSLK